MASRAVARDLHPGRRRRWLAVALSERRPRRRRRRRRCRSSPPSTSGSPSASVTRRRRRPVAPTRVAPTATPVRPGATVTPCPTSAASRVISASMAPVASTSAQRRHRGDVGRVQRRAGRRPARCRSAPGRRSAGSGRRHLEPVDRTVVARRPRGRRRAACTSPSRPPPPVSAAGDVAAVDLAGRSRAWRSVSCAPISLPSGIAAASVTAIGRPSPVAWPVAVSGPPSRGSTSAEVGERTPRSRCRCAGSRSGRSRRSRSAGWRASGSRCGSRPRRAPPGRRPRSRRPAADRSARCRARGRWRCRRRSGRSRRSAG